MPSDGLGCNHSTPLAIRGKRLASSIKQVQSVERWKAPIVTLAGKHLTWQVLGGISVTPMWPTGRLNATEIQAFEFEIW